MDHTNPAPVIETDQPPLGAPETAKTPGLGLRRLFIGGAISLGFAVALQRAFGFLTTALAARIGGVSVLGKYSVALSTAGLVSAFVGTGVGTIALRYISQFPRHTRAYRKILRLLILIAAVAGISSTVILFLGAPVIAHLVLKNESLKTVLQIAALSSLAFVLFEAMNGILVGLNNFRGLVCLSLVSGAAMLLSVAYGSRYGASVMIAGHASAFIFAVLITILLARVSIQPKPAEGSLEPAAPTTREVILFGNTQQVNTIVMTIASWLVIVFVTRFDSSFREMAYYVVGSQMRVLATQAPALVSQLVLPALARTGPVETEQSRVISASTFLCVVISFVPSAFIVMALPWVLSLYGPTFQSALIATALLVATAVAQVSYIPAANALLMLNLRKSMLVNAAWATVLVILSLALATRFGAAGAAAAWLGSQLFSQAIVFGVLKRMGRLPDGVWMTCVVGDLGIVLVAALAVARAGTGISSVPILAAQLLTTALISAVLFRVAQRRGYLPRNTRSALAELRTAPTILMGYLVTPKSA
ncbi:MAG TPA: oligosaccharide flippase family protein [Pyrinomonadaceae bacterium]|jgi:O-antigen/teichoic acid export membrane protein|nr:oligosaccharide flippase family protein [Pyrinomonadaceae bacterium]